MKNTTEKTTVRFTIDFFEKEIIGTKASFNKAGKGCGPEYEELAEKMAKHPDFQLVIKEQKHQAVRAKNVAELVGACPSCSHKQHGSVVERSRSPVSVAVADDAPGKPSHVPH